MSRKEDVNILDETLSLKEKPENNENNNISIGFKKNRSLNKNKDCSDYDRF